MRPYGPDTLFGRKAPVKRTRDALATLDRPLQTPHCGSDRASDALRRWAIPGSVALTEGIIVIFFSSP